MSRSLLSQIPANLFAKIISFASALFLGLWLAPFFIKNLGLNAYGIIPVCMAILSYAAIISTCISKPVIRFTLIEINKKNGCPGKVFNTSFSIFCIVSLVQLPILFYLSEHIENILTVDAQYLEDSRILLKCIAISFIANQFSSIFNVGILAQNRVDLDEWIRAGKNLARFALLYYIFKLTKPSLITFGVIELSLGLVALSIRIALWFKFAPYLRKIKLRIDSNFAKGIIGMSGWVLVSYMGSVFILKSNILILNRLISAETASVWGALSQWDDLIRSSAAMLATITVPVIYILTGKGNKSLVHKITSYTTRILCSALALICATIIVFSRDILSIWLDPSYAQFSLLLNVMVVPLFINVGIMPLIQYLEAENKIKWHAIATVIVGLASVVINSLGCEYGLIGAMGVSLVTSILLLMRNLGFTILYAGNATGQGLRFFYPDILKAIALFLVSIPILMLLRYSLLELNYTTLGLTSVFFVAIILSYVYYIIISGKERTLVTKEIARRIIRT